MSSIAATLKLLNPIPLTFRSQEHKEAAKVVRYLRDTSSKQAQKNAVESTATFCASKKKTDLQKATSMLVVAAKVYGARSNNVNDPFAMDTTSRLIAAKAKTLYPGAFDEALSRAKSQYKVKSTVQDICVWASNLGSAAAIIGVILILCGTITTGGAFLLIPAAIALLGLVAVFRAQNVATRLDALEDIRKSHEVLSVPSAEQPANNQEIKETQETKAKVQ